MFCKPSKNSSNATSLVISKKGLRQYRLHTTSALHTQRRIYGTRALRSAHYLEPHSFT